MGGLDDFPRRPALLDDPVERRGTKKHTDAETPEALGEATEEIEKLRTDFEDLTDRHLRLVAEFNNFRGRFQSIHGVDPFNFSYTAHNYDAFYLVALAASGAAGARRPAATAPVGVDRHADGCPAGGRGGPAP